MKDLEQLPRLYITGNIGPKDGLFDALGGKSFSAEDTRQFLRDYKDEPEIVVEISSDGGYKTEGIEIFNILRNSGKKITTIGYKVNSIATVIMLAGDVRLIAEHAQFVVHFSRIDPVNLGVDALTSKDFQDLADATERTDRELVDIYCSVLGEEKRMVLTASMADESDLGARGAIKLGFATGYYKKRKKEKAVTEDDFRGVVINEHLALIIENNMTKQEQDDKILSLEKTVINGFKKLFAWGGRIKNEVTLPLQDGGSVYVVPANPDAPDELKDAKVFTVDEAGLPTETPAPDGTHVLADGRTITVAGGVVTEVLDPIDAKKLEEENKALAEANASLLAKVSELEAKMVADKAEALKEVDIIKNSFEEFKKLVPGDKGGKEQPKDIKVENKKGLSINEIRAQLEQSKIK